MNLNCEAYKHLTESKTFKYIVYVALLSTTMVFVTNMIQEYQQGDTLFKSSKENITKKDVPVLTICFKSKNKLHYGMDFTLQALSMASSKNSTFKTLPEGITAYDYHHHNAHETHTVFLKQLTLDDSFLVNRSCISMHMTLTNADNWVSLGMFIINMYLVF